MENESKVFLMDLDIEFRKKEKMHKLFEPALFIYDWIEFSLL